MNARHGHSARRRYFKTGAWLLAAATLPGSAAIADEPATPDAFEPCAACHSYLQDEAALEAPPLWGVVGRPIAAVEGFEYSTALTSLGGSWDRERLDRFLRNPSAFVPGTKMRLGGVPDEADRFAILDFLEQLTPAKPDAGEGE